jgi:uncharacterized protein (DUF2062 family)
MFKRRKKPSLLRRSANLMWPSIGWKRSSLYLMHRVGRMKGTPHGIAAGLASGAAVSFTPFLGWQTLLGLGLAWVLRANLIASVLGASIVANPWALPLILIWLYNSGVWMMGGNAGAPDPDFVALFADLARALASFDFQYVYDTAWPVLAPMVLSSIPSAIVAWIVFYAISKPLVASYRQRRVDAAAARKVRA